MNFSSKRNKVILAGSVLLLLVLAVALIIYLLTSVSYTGEIRGSVGAPVQIERDQHGVPTIRAKTREDAYFTLGYLHARDRLIQIEYFRAIALGRISELVGSDGFILDRLTVAVGLTGIADQMVKNLRDPYGIYLKSYIDGINTYKRRHVREILKFSDVLDDEWRTADVVAVLLLLEWADGYLNNKELLFPLPPGVEPRVMKDLLPEDLIFNYTLEEKNDIIVLREIRKILARYLGSYNEGFAFYVDAKNTREEKPFFAFNLESSLRVYPVWYPVRLVLDGMNIDGMTLSGLPFLFHGSNGAFSFSRFNIKADTQDFCVEKIRLAKEGDQYLSRGGWKDFEQSTEIRWIGKRKKKSDKVAFAVRRTKNGPVISDIFEGLYKTSVITLNSMFTREDGIAALLELPFADSVNRGKAVLKNIQSMPAVYLLAAQDGAVLVYTGKIPVRVIKGVIFREGGTYEEARRLMDLSDLNPGFPRGNLIAGNAMIEDEPAALKEYLMAKDTSRLLRLRGLLEREKAVDRKYVEDCLRDTRSSVAEKYVPLFLALLDKVPITSAKLSRIYFHEWDFSMDFDSIPATVFQTLLVHLIKEAVGDELKEDTDAWMENYYLLTDNFLKMLQDDKSLLFDDKSTREKVETRDMIFDRAFLKSMRFLNRRFGPIMESWKWGMLHRGQFAIPLTRDGTFLTKNLYKIKERIFSGGNGTLLKSSINANDGMSVRDCTALSWIGDFASPSLFPSFGISLNPRSEYFDNDNPAGGFISLGKPEIRYTRRIIPLK